MNEQIPERVENSLYIKQFSFSKYEDKTYFTFKK